MAVLSLEELAKSGTIDIQEYGLMKTGLKGLLKNIESIKLLQRTITNTLRYLEKITIS